MKTVSWSLYTWNDDEGKKAFWHSTSHIVAQALEEFYPGVKLTIGPAIENGFYYDVDLPEGSISEKDFPAIEKKPWKLPEANMILKCVRYPKPMPWQLYKSQGNEYKVELIENLEDGTITFCDHDTFTDLCRGGHIPNTGIVKAIKILNVAGAYWRGDENKHSTYQGLRHFISKTKRTYRIP